MLHEPYATPSVAPTGGRRRRRRNVHLLQMAFFGLAIASSVSGAQAAASRVQLRVGGAAPDVFAVDVPQLVSAAEPPRGYFAIPGEWLVLDAGRHVLSFSSSFAQGLTIELDVSESEVTLSAQSIVDRLPCGETRTVLEAWTATLRLSDTRQRKFELILDSPRAGASQMSAQCSTGPGRGGEFRNHTVTFKSVPTGAVVLEENRRLGTTDRTVSLVYGMVNGQPSQDKRLRVAMPGRTGDCRYLLSDLLRRNVTTITCTFR